MRSKEVDGVINRLNVLCDFGLSTILQKEQIQDIDTALSYIETLEQLPNKIRDKIKELEELRDKYINENKFGSFMEVESKIRGLKEIIGEK